MPKDKLPINRKEPILGLVQKIKAGELDAALLSKEQRQLCVEALYLESISPAGIAQFLKVTDRTIRRDLADIRTQHALSPDPELARQIIGEYVLFSRLHKANLMKLARNNAASTAERAQSEYYAHMVGSDMIAKLQSLGYLPKSADALVVLQKSAEHNDEKLAEICAEISAMAKLADTPEAATKLLDIQQTLVQENLNDAK